MSEPDGRVKLFFISVNFFLNCTSKIENMEKLVLETIQQKRLLDIDEVDPINDTDYEVLEKVRQILNEYNYTDRFGITLLHKHFDVEQDEILMEDTDTENRISTIKVEKGSNQSGKTIETMWKFGKGVSAATVCVLRCNYNSGHRAYHAREKR